MENLEKVRISRFAKYHLSCRKAEVQKPSWTSAERALKNKKSMALEGYQKKLLLKKLIIFASHVLLLPRFRINPVI